MSEWKPIETAPRDGTTILLCDFLEEDIELRGPFFGWWVGDDDAPWNFVWVGDHNGRACLQAIGYFLAEDPPTHWMPLPEPPKE